MAGCQQAPIPAPLPEAECEYGGGGQPAIAFTASLHYHSSSDGDLDFYERSRDQADWLASWAEENGLLLELALNGYQAEGALAAGEVDRYRELYEAGHGFGVHHHPTAWRRELEWQYMGKDAPSEQLQHAVDDHRRWIGEALEPLGIPFNGGHVGLTGRDEWWDGMMQESGYTSETLDAWSYAATDGEEDSLNFDLLHPFRWEVGGEPGTLEYDPDVPYVLIPSHSQPGTISEGGHLRYDGSAAHIMNSMLLAYLEWRAAVLEGAAPRVWVFGVTIHPDQGRQHNDDLKRLAGFLQRRFLAPLGAGQGRSVCAATRDDILEAYGAWEADLAGEVPFRFAPGDDYPYRLSHLSSIYSAHLIEMDDSLLDSGVQIAVLGEMEDSGEGTLEDLELEHRWLLIWADTEQPVEVDIRAWTRDRVRPQTSLGLGDEVRPSRVLVEDEPVLIQLD